MGVHTYENILRPTQNPSLAGMDPLTTTPTASSVRFILDNIAFAPLVDIFLLHGYAIILGILVIHFLMALKLGPFSLPC